MEDKQRPGASLSPIARQLAESVADCPLNLDAVTDEAINAAADELVAAKLATTQNRPDGRLMLIRTAVPL